MKIVKRNGEQVNFSPNKILTRIKKTAKGLKVNADRLAIEVQTYLYDGITTQAIDDQTAKLAAQYAINHPDYSLLASRIISSKLHKDFGVGVESWKARLTHLLKPEIFEKQVKWGVEPDYSYDESFDFLGISSFITVYGVKDEKYDRILGQKTETLQELPAEMMFRVALYLSESKEEFEYRYARLIGRNYGGATPVLMNSGTPNSSMISCSVNELMGDSLEGIHETLHSISKMSKDGAGIGLWAGRLRSSKTRYSNKGKAGGIGRFAKVLDAHLRFFKQNENRRGKGALYLNIWHRDLHSFIELASKEGSEETTARDLMLALVINDLFYKRLIGEDVVVKIDENGNEVVVEKQWSLFCPHDIKEIMGYNLYDYWGEEFEKRYKECENNPELPRTTVSCDDVVLWFTNMQSKSGHPYILNIDNVNRVNNQKNYGIIKMSQLCVSYDTNILTDRGNIVIGEHVGEKHNIWNGKEFSEVEILKTGENQKLLTVTLTDGTVINATEYHRWFINEDGKEVEKQTKDLVEGDKIIKFDLPILRGHKELESAYTKGLFSADGHLADNGYSKLPMINLYGDKKQLVEFLDIRNVETGTGRTSIEIPNSKYISEYTDKTVVGLNRKIQDKNFVPLGDYTLESKLQWLSGLADGDGTTVVNEGFKTIQISSTNKEFLIKVKLMLTEIGVQSKIRLSIESGVRSLPNHKDGYSDYECGAVYRLLISSYYLNHLIKLGLETKRLDLTNKKTDRNCFRYNTIESVTDNGLIEDTYCVQEPKEQRAVFNGVLTGNCIEIVQYTDVDISAQCCLGAMLLASYVKNGKFDFEALREYTADLNYMLNRVIDKNDWSNEYSKKGGLSQRATAIGVAGFADVLYMLDISFESDEAKELNKRIFETIYYGSIEGSVKYRKENPHIFDSEVANMLDGTEVGQGRFVWEKYDDAVPTMDWDSLRSEVLKHGVANSMFCATMPTASSSTLAMQNEMYEPMQDIAVVRKTISGEFPFINKYLIDDLEKKGLLIEELVTDIKRANSIQNISFERYTNDIEWINHIRAKYKTIWEMPQRVMVELAADRQRFIDQAQSMNLYWAEPSVKKLTSALVKGWKSGLKTGVYYTKTKPKTQADKSLGLGVKETQQTVNINNPSSDFFCDGCSA